MPLLYGARLRICHSDWKVADASRNYAADNASNVAEEQYHTSYTESLLYPEVLETTLSSNISLLFTGGGFQ